MPKRYVKKQKGITTIARPIAGRKENRGGLRWQNPSLPTEAQSRRERILRYMQGKPPATVSEIADALGMTKLDADRALQRLFRDGRVNYSGKRDIPMAAGRAGVWWVINGGDHVDN